MPLPSAQVARSLEWPPPHMTAYVRQAREWGAWWAGDVDLLRNYSAERRYWHRQAAAEGNRNRNAPQARAMHAALAADIVTTSADLLFGDEVGLVIPAPEATGDAGEHVDADADGVAEGDASLAQEAAAVDVTQARLAELRDDLDLDGTLLEAAEVAAALGGAWLRPAWNTTIADRPLLSVIDPEYAVPEYRMGELVAVTFWETVREGGGDNRVWRHLERHEAVVDPLGNVFGVILHGLYDGDRDTLGTPRALTAHAATAGLDEAVPVPEAAGPIMPRYMPNVRPNRKSRKLPIGRSDFDGVEDMLDALDETWSALLRDIRLGVARVFAREGTLERVAPGTGAGKTFDVDRELIVETETDPDKAGAPVTMTQGAIRDGSLLATIRALTEGIVSAAGYAPATFGLGVDGAAESGTARAIRERKTFRTLRRKRRYAQRAVADVCLSLLAIDAEVFGRDIVPMRPRVDWPDVTTEPRDTAERLQLLRAAQAISVRNAVREAQPDLEGSELDEEVSRIMAELSVADPDALLLDSPAEPVEPEVDDPDLEVPAA